MTDLGSRAIAVSSGDEGGIYPKPSFLDIDYIPNKVKEVCHCKETLLSRTL